MIETITQKYIEVLKNDEQEYDAYIILADGTRVDTDISKLRITYNLGEKIIGNFTSKKVEFNLFNTSLYNITNKEFEVFVGLKVDGEFEYTSMGKYIADKPVIKDEALDECMISGQSYSIKFKKPYVPVIPFPCTINVAIKSICNYLNISYVENNFINANYVLNNFFIEETATFYDVIKILVEAGFANAYITTTNALIVRSPSMLIDYKFDLNELFELKKGDNKFGKLNSIVASRIVADDGSTTEDIYARDKTSITSNGLYEYKIIQNEAIDYDRQTAVDNILARILDFEYTQATIETVYNPKLEIGDMLKVPDKKTNTFFLLFAKEITADLSTGLMTIESSEQTKTETDYTSATNKDKRRITEAKVNKLEGKITLLAEEQGEIKEQIVKSVENIEGMQTITLPNCVEGNLLEFYIYGHNTDFNMLVPDDDLYPNDDLFPIGSGASSIDTYTIEVENEDGTKETYDLGEIVLLSKIGDVQDEYVLKDGKASVIRRIDVENVDIQEEVIEELGKKTIFLKNGTNTITLLNYNAKIKAKYVVKNTYTDIFATKSETNAQINIKASEVSTEVNSSVTSAILTLLNNGYLTAEQVNSLVEGNTEEIATIKKQLKQTVTDSQMQIAISTAIGGGVSYFKNTLFTINEQGMWIATSEDEFNALYNNKGMYLYSYEQMIAKFDVNGATLNNLKVLGTVETPHSKKMVATVNGEERVYDFWVD